MKDSVDISAVQKIYKKCRLKHSIILSLIIWFNVVHFELVYEDDIFNATDSIHLDAINPSIADWRAHNKA